MLKESIQRGRRQVGTKAYLLGYGEDAGETRKLGGFSTSCS